MAEYWQRTRRGVTMTSYQFRVLRLLRDAKAAEFPFIDLVGVDKRTIRNLHDQDWIFVSPGLDGTRYTITERGERALRVHEEPLRRNPNSICPTCKERPRHVTKSGRISAYCLECARDLSRRKWEHRAPRFKSDTCPRCKKRPRHEYPGGGIATYCTHCVRVMKRRNKRKNKQRKLDAARRGELMCITCKVKPRHHTDVSVYDYCMDCLRAYQTQYNDQRRPNSPSAKARSRRKVSL